VGYFEKSLVTLILRNPQSTIPVPIRARVEGSGELLVELATTAPIDTRSLGVELTKLQVSPGTGGATCVQVPTPLVKNDVVEIEIVPPASVNGETNWKLTKG
jgi:hypothetical protein